MSTITWSDEGKSPIGALLIGLFILILLAFLFVGVQTKSHAVIRHGDDAIAIRKCLNDNGEYMIWQSLTQDNKFFRVCELGPGRFGLQIVQCIVGGTCEKTAFIKGNGTWLELLKYLENIAEVFYGNVPW